MRKTEKKNVVQIYVHVYNFNREKMRERDIQREKEWKRKGGRRKGELFIFLKERDFNVPPY